MDDMLSASAAAEELGYASDYIGRLCRESKLEGTRVSNMWFVSKDALAAYECERAKLQADRIKRQVDEMHEADYARSRKGLSGGG